MRESARPAATAATLVALLAPGGCGEGRTLSGSAPAVASVAELADRCAGDSLRPATAAPAQGLWLYEGRSGERVAAMIGPQRSDDRALMVSRPVETVEVSAAGDTIRHRAAAATVSLELLPGLGQVTLGDGTPADSSASAHPAATYPVSARVRLAAYEACATSRRGPRVRYLRRDAAGRIVTDVMLHRASDQ